MTLQGIFQQIKYSRDNARNYLEAGNTIKAIEFIEELKEDTEAYFSHGLSKKDKDLEKMIKRADASMHTRIHGPFNRRVLVQEWRSDILNDRWEHFGFSLHPNKSNMQKHNELFLDIYSESVKPRENSQKWISVNRGIFNITKECDEYGLSLRKDNEDFLHFEVLYEFILKKYGKIYE